MSNNESIREALGRAAHAFFAEVENDDRTLAFDHCSSDDIELLVEAMLTGAGVMVTHGAEGLELVKINAPDLYLPAEPSGESVAVTQFQHPQWSDKTRWHDCDDAESGSETMGLIGMIVRTLYVTPPDTVPRSELDQALLERDTAIGMVDEARVMIAGLQAKAVPDGVAIAKARDEWFASPEGQKCVCADTLTGDKDKYLRNRLERAFLAGANVPRALSAAPAPAAIQNGPLEDAHGPISSDAPAASPVVPEACEWREDEDGNWKSKCGVYWVFTTGGPLQNDMTFCTGCGKRLCQALPASDLSGSEK